MRTKEELDRLRERAIALRREGKSRREIKAILPTMSNSTLSGFLEGVPPPDWTRRARAKDELRTAARDLHGAVAYWCEGAKSKPHRHVERVAFINSDPALIGFFLRFLDTACIPRDDLIFRVYIHETADVEEAHRFWLDFTGTQPSQFRKPVLKHHNPKTVRKNVGEGYRGCLRIDVRRSGDLYRKIEGWAAGAMLG
jgi:hypothetical protein